MATRAGVDTSRHHNLQWTNGLATGFGDDPRRWAAGSPGPA